MSKQKYTPGSLAQRLDEVLPPDTLTQAETDNDPLIEAAAELANAPRPALSTDAMARIQAQVLEAQRQQINTQTTQQSNSRVIRLQPALRWMLVAGLAIVVLFAASVPPALASVPGDVLYPVKQVLETVELGLATTPESQASVYLNFAERRTQELEVLLERGTLDSQLVDAALNNMIRAGESAQTGSVDTTLLQTRTTAITTQLNSVLQTAASKNPNDNVAAVLGAAQATQSSGALMLLVPPMPTHTPLPNTPIPSAQPTEEAPPLPSATPSVPVETEATPLPVTESPVPPTPTELPVNLIIEGPIEAINGNILIIYGIEVVVSINDPLLSILRIGDVIRVDGSVQGDVNQTVIAAVEIDTVDVDTTVNPDGSNEVWRDSGDCSNPPPAWAPANGWRARCQGQSSPGNSGNNNNGNGNGNSSGNGNNGNNNNNGNNGNNGNGQGNQGRGNGKGNN